MGSEADSIAKAMEKRLRISNSKHGNLFREDNRLKTFANWKVDFIDKHELAMMGFYFEGPRDLVRCAFCDESAAGWEPYDKVFIAHFITNANCPLLTFSAYDNVPLDPEKLDHVLLSASYDTCKGCDNTVLRIDRYDRKWEVHTPTTPNHFLKLDTLRSVHPQYNTFGPRHRTYQYCGWNCKKDPFELCDAGFFYTKFSDKVTCFSCGVTISGWRVEDCPWEVHAYAFSSCEFVRTFKGQALIDHAMRKFSDSANVMAQRITNPPSTCSPAAQATTSTGIELPNRTCKICLDKEYNMAFVPCGHVVTCEDCAKSVSTCPVCRKSITSRSKIYLG